MVLHDDLRSALRAKLGSSSPRPLCGCVDPFEKQEAAYIIDDVGRSNPHGARMTPTVRVKMLACDF